MKKLLLMASLLGFMTGTLSAQTQPVAAPSKTQTPPAKAKMEVVKDKASASTPAKKEIKPSAAQKMKSDGTPDKRFKENKNVKKDGTPDKRFKANKKDAAAKKTN